MLRRSTQKTPSEEARAREHWRELVHHLVTQRGYRVIVKQDVVLLISPDGQSTLTLPREFYEL